MRVPLFQMTCFISLLLFSSSCGASLDTTARNLRAGMNRVDVDSLFNNFHSTPQDEFHERILERSDQGPMGKPLQRVVFEDNVDRGTAVGYSPSWGEFEVCMVFFDTNRIIAGYEYYRFK
jgi:hypothetical protein